VGTNGTILHTINGGSTWTAQTSGITEYLFGVSFTNGNTWTAVGSRGIILHTTNGGATWAKQWSGTTENLQGVSFADANTGTAVGSSGTILRTANGGSTWVVQSSGTTSGLCSVSFVDANTGVVVGVGGTILRTTNGGATAVREECVSIVPSEFVLMQNFPNPFNPTTSIGYTVGATSNQQTAGSWVRLVVYDVLGREVKVLMDGQKVAGTYHVEFDGSQLSSGVFFYRFTAGDYVETKRMMLLR